MAKLKNALNTTVEIFDATEQVFKRIGRLLNLVPRSKPVPVLSFPEVIEYFIEERPKNAKVTRGAIMREPHRRGFIVTQVFLDEQNRVYCPGGTPYGRRLVVRQLDDELAHKFGDTNLILVK